MSVLVRKHKKAGRRISQRKLLFIGISVIFLVIVAPPAFKLLRLYIKYGYSITLAIQHDNLLNFGVVIPLGYKVHGIDISHHQKEINWNDVASIDVKGTKIHFAFMKATEGITRQDIHFSENWEKSKDAGLIRGAYHFYYPTRDARKQAENFINIVTLSPGDLPPVLDIEVSKGKSKADIVKGCIEWCNIIEAHYGVKPIIYTNVTFYDKYLKDDFGDYPLWVAHYYKDVPRLSHRKWIFWQHTDCATINGIKKPVDLNVYNGSLEELLSLCIK